MDANDTHGERVELIVMKRRRWCSDRRQPYRLSWCEGFTRVSLCIAGYESSKSAADPSTPNAPDALLTHNAHALGNDTERSRPICECINGLLACSLLTRAINSTTDTAVRTYLSPCIKQRPNAVRVCCLIGWLRVD